MQHLEGSGTPVLYIGRTVLKVKAKLQNCQLLSWHVSRDPEVEKH